MSELHLPLYVQAHDALPRLLAEFDGTCHDRHGPPHTTGNGVGGPSTTTDSPVVSRSSDPGGIHDSRILKQESCEPAAGPAFPLMVRMTVIAERRLSNRFDVVCDELCAAFRADAHARGVALVDKVRVSFDRNEGNGLPGGAIAAVAYARVQEAAGG